MIDLTVTIEEIQTECARIGHFVKVFSNVQKIAVYMAELKQTETETLARIATATTNAEAAEAAAEAAEAAASARVEAATARGATIVTEAEEQAAQILANTQADADAATAVAAAAVAEREDEVEALRIQAAGLASEVTAAQTLLAQLNEEIAAARASIRDLLKA